MSMEKFQFHREIMMWTEGRRQQKSNSQKTIWANRTLKEKYIITNKIAEAMKGKHLSEEHKQKISKALIGKKYPGRKLTQATKNKISIALKGLKKLPRSEKDKKRISLFMKRLWKQSDYAKYMKESRRSSFESKEYREKRSEITKCLWNKSEFVKKQMKARNITPNKTELMLNEILQRILPNNYKFVGDGEFILAGKCPDFVNVNGQKKIIELFGNYWHKDDTGEKRIALFKQYGYKTLIIWEEELRDEDVLKEKLLRFNGEVSVS